MNIRNYLADRKIEIILSGFLLIAVTWLLIIFRSNTAVTIIVVGLILLVEVVKLIYDYKRKMSFYNAFQDNVRRLDQAYLVLETLEKPEFLEGQILVEVLYDIDKSMVENVNTHVLRSKDFREYIELWIHEVKLPLASIGLKLHNLIETSSKNSDSTNEKEVIETYRKLQSEVRRIEDYVDQVLYYSRSENAEKDYHIAEVPLSKIVHTVAMDLRETFQDNGIDLRIENISDVTLNTDQKWFAFILGQLVSNSIKYKREIEDSYIRITADQSNTESDKMDETDSLINIYVEDNGIGIPDKDLKRVFDKSFTGSNGVARSKSTGMGLYIVKTLCEKLGHRISIESSEGEWTRVCITVKKDEFFDIK